MKEQEKSLKGFVKETVVNSERALQSEMEAMESRIMSELKSRRGRESS